MQLIIRATKIIRDGYNRGQFHRSNYVDRNERKNEDKSVCFMGQVINDEYRKMKTNEMLTFFVDSGCTDHMVNQKQYFCDLVMLENPIKVAVAKDKEFLLAVGIGNIVAYSIVKNQRLKCTIKNVLYVPNLRKNLLSVKKLEMSNMKVIFENGFVKLFDKNMKQIAIGERKNLYELSFDVKNLQCLNVENINNDFMK